MQLATTSSCESLAHLCTLNVTVTLRHIKPYMSSLVIAWQRLPTMDITLLPRSCLCQLDTVSHLTEFSSVNCCWPGQHRLSSFRAPSGGGRLRTFFLDSSHYMRSLSTDNTENPASNISVVLSRVSWLLPSDILLVC